MVIRIRNGGKSGNPSCTWCMDFTNVERLKALDLLLCYG